MARPMEKVIGNETIANSPNFANKPSEERGTPPTNEEISALDKAMDDSGIKDLPKEQVEADIALRQAGKTPAKTETPTTEPDPEAGRKITPTPSTEKPTTTPVATPAVEAKVPPSGLPPKVEPAKEPAKDEEIDSIQEPRGLNPANRDNWNKVKGIAKREKSARVELDGKYKEAVATINKLYQEKEKLPEPIQKELEDHRLFRKTFDYERNEEFKAKFVKPIADTEEDILKLLKENDLDDKSIEEIKKLGVGNVKKSTWDTMIKALTDSESQNEREAGIVLRKLVNQHAEKSVDKKQEIEKMGKGQSEWLKNQEETQKAEITKEAETVKANLDKLQKDYDFLRPVQAPADATPEQKKAVEEHNGFIKTLEKQFVVSYRPASADQRFDTAMKATYAMIADRELVKANATISQLQEQLKTATDEIGAIKNSTRMNPEVGETAGNGTKKGSFSKAEDYVGMKDGDAVEKAMQQAGI